MTSSPMFQRHKPSHMQFHMIKHEDLTWVQLNIFKKFKYIIINAEVVTTTLLFYNLFLFIIFRL